MGDDLIVCRIILVPVGIPIRRPKMNFRISDAHLAIDFQSHLAEVRARPPVPEPGLQNLHLLPVGSPKRVLHQLLKPETLHPFLIQGGLHAILNPDHFPVSMSKKH